MIASFHAKGAALGAGVQPGVYSRRLGPWHFRCPDTGGAERGTHGHLAHPGGVDADGVALAAIKGLNEKLETTVAEQGREIAEPRRLVEQLIDRR